MACCVYLHSIPTHSHHHERPEVTLSPVQTPSPHANIAGNVTQLDLPQEVIRHIFSQYGTGEEANSLLNCGLVNRLWMSMSRDIFFSRYYCIFTTSTTKSIQRIDRFLDLLEAPHTTFPAHIAKVSIQTETVIGPTPLTPKAKGAAYRLLETLSRLNVRLTSLSAILRFITPEGGNEATRLELLHKYLDLNTERLAVFDFHIAYVRDLSHFTAFFGRAQQLKILNVISADFDHSGKQDEELQYPILPYSLDDIVIGVPSNVDHIFTGWLSNAPGLTRLTLEIALDPDRQNIAALNLALRNLGQSSQLTWLMISTSPVGQRSSNRHDFQLDLRPLVYLKHINYKNRVKGGPEDISLTRTLLNSATSLCHNASHSELESISLAVEMMSTGSSRDWKDTYRTIVRVLEECLTECLPPIVSQVRASCVLLFDTVEAEGVIKFKGPSVSELQEMTARLDGLCEVVRMVRAQERQYFGQYTEVWPAPRRTANADSSRIPTLSSVKNTKWFGNFRSDMPSVDE